MLGRDGVGPENSKDSSWGGGLMTSPTGWPACTALQHVAGILTSSSFLSLSFFMKTVIPDLMLFTFIICGPLKFIF